MSDRYDYQISNGGHGGPSETQSRRAWFGPSPVAPGLTESLAGRFEILHLPHWTYAEMKAAFKWSPNQYLFYGGYPGAAPLIKDHDRWVRYVNDALIPRRTSVKWG